MIYALLDEKGTICIGLVLPLTVKTLYVLLFCYMDNNQHFDYRMVRKEKSKNIKQKKLPINNVNCIISCKFLAMQS